MGSMRINNKFAQEASVIEILSVHLLMKYADLLWRSFCDLHAKNAQKIFVAIPSLEELMEVPE
jgi:hypothetical protein